MNVLEKILQFPPGYSEAVYNNRKYSVLRRDFNNHKSIKLYAQELGGKDFISCNLYITETKQLLKPCEMPEQKVIRFLSNCQLLTS